MVRVPAAKNLLGKIAGRIAPQSGATALRPGLATVARQARGITGSQQQTHSLFSKERSKSVYEYGAHRSDAEAKIAEVPVVWVDGPVALCDGGERRGASAKYMACRCSTTAVRMCCCCARTLFPSKPVRVRM